MQRQASFTTRDLARQTYSYPRIFRVVVAHAREQVSAAYSREPAVRIINRAASDLQEAAACTLAAYKCPTASSLASHWKRKGGPNGQQLPRHPEVRPSRPLLMRERAARTGGRSRRLRGVASIRSVLRTPDL